MVKDIQFKVTYRLNGKVISKEEAREHALKRHAEMLKEKTK